MAKLILDMDAMEENFFADTALIGIVSPLASHRFCGTLNRMLDTDFKRNPKSDPLVVKEQEYYFHFYEYILPLNGGKYAIYQLKNGKEVLLPEIKQLDYLLLVECAGADIEAERLMGLLRNISDIQLAQIIPAERLKNSSHLLV